MASATEYEADESITCNRRSVGLSETTYQGRKDTMSTSDPASGGHDHDLRGPEKSSSECCNKVCAGPRVQLPRWRGSSGARRTRGAVKPLRCKTRSMVRRPGNGRTERALSSARMAVAPTRLERVAGAACAWRRRRMEGMVRSSSGRMDE